MVDFEDIFDNPVFYVLSGVGMGAFLLMLMVLKGMGNSDIMPWWVKIVTFIAIPIAAAAFTGYASDN